jgi:hypothetical protein
MYGEWKVIFLCWFSDVQRVEGIRIVLKMYMEWKDILFFLFAEITRVEGNRIFMIRECTDNGRK